ncbi:hypothetical protein [Celeribacter litoreus]|uniref:hypothetical protein n=1 Tax=Celeribacter litoreus TaxID=2876714 RepID=UPI001CCFD917|nr:hypothetical protein [Celeribacter litoreus]MCA0044669.1 hypothetical protein [Celeribacter litoreus]
MPPRSKRPLADKMLQLSIRQVVEAGLLSDKGIVSIAKTPQGLDFPAIVDGHGDYLIITVHGGWGNTCEAVAITETPCHFGGTRHWFFCPSCARRCGVLYIGRETIACRTCHDLAYASQYEAPRERMLRQLKKIRKAIGADMDIYGPFNPPPKGMSKKRWLEMIEEFKALRQAYWHECERPCRWRNDAPKTRDFRKGSTQSS